MVRLRIVILVLLLPFSGHAEPYFGGKIAINQAKWSRVSDIPSEFARPYKTGYSFGGVTQLRKWLPFVLQGEAALTERGTDVEELDGSNAGFFSLLYLDIGILIRSEYSYDIWTPYVIVGPQFSYMIKATGENRDGSTFDARSGQRVVDIAAVAGVGIAFGPFPWGTVTIEARYDHGLRAEDVIVNADLFNRTLSLNLGYEFRRAPRGPRDRDHDGLFDDSDTCPDQPEDFNDFEDDDGCPDGDKDDDADGVLDAQDQCRGEAEDMDGVEDEDGCPDLDEPAPGDAPEDAPTDSDSGPNGDNDDPTGTPGDGNPEARLFHAPSCTKVSVTPGREHLHRLGRVAG